MSDVRYVNEGFNDRRGAYDVIECHGSSRVYVFDGYMRGNVMTLYPRCAIVKGERRGKKTVSVFKIETGC